MDRTLDRTVFETPWFRLVERTVGDAPHPHYTLIPPDYVSVLALTDRNEVLLVRQFRPAVGAETLELPSGHVEAGQTPAMAALTELQEETGYTAESCASWGPSSPTPVGWATVCGRSSRRICSRSAMTRPPRKA